MVSGIAGEWIQKQPGHEKSNIQISNSGCLGLSLFIKITLLKNFNKLSYSNTSLLKNFCNIWKLWFVNKFVILGNY